MSRAVFLFALCALGAACGAVGERRAAHVPNCALTPQTVIVDSGIGALRIGLWADSAKSRCRVVSDTMWWDDEYTEQQRVLLVELHRDTVAALVDEEGRIRRIVVGRPWFATADSIRVGTRLGALRTRPGIAGAVGELYAWVRLPAYCGLAFVLSDAGTFEHGDNLGPEALAKLPTTTEVSGIQIDGCASMRGT